MRLIDADKLKERAIAVLTEKGDKIYIKAVGTREIDRQPTVDPVVHGRWHLGCNGFDCRCSVCGCEFDNIANDVWEDWEYCPNCGAKMDLEVSE